MMITTERLVIQPAQHGDAHAIALLWNNPAIMRNVGFPEGLHTSADSVLSQIQKSQDTQSRTSPFLDTLLSIRLFETEQFIGQAMIHRPNSLGHCVTDVKLDPAFHGKGFGTETKRALIKIAFTETDCIAVEATPNIDNIASIRMQEAVGAIRCGRGRHLFPIHTPMPVTAVNYWLYRCYKENHSAVDMRKRRFSYAAIVPAAGRSTRMGKFKQLLPWPPDSQSSMTVLESTVNNLLLAGCNAIAVVAGHRENDVRKTLKNWPVTCLSNPSPDAPMSSSVTIAAQTLNQHDTAYLLLPGDHPAVSPETIRNLIAHHEAQPGCIHLPQTSQKRTGHPALFPPDSIDHLLNPDPDSGLRALIHSGPFPVLRHPVTDTGIVRNLDFPEDYGGGGEVGGR